jgi:paraquat-inducible protein B
MTEPQAEISERRRISAIWLVPIVALLLGIWMVIYTLRSQGPEITIVFSSAEGIEAGKTKLKLLSVDVGLVESAGLAEDLERVVVKARLEKAAAPLLREDTQFWVVRPRIGTGGVSGLGTLLSGGYIQLAPGTGAKGRREFVGLEEPPVTPTGTPGLQLRLVSDHAGSVSSGDPILYKGFRVGRVESAEFDVPSQQMQYGAFIEAPYDDLVTSATRFWDASGISVSATSDGIQVETASLETLLIGGVAMGLPKDVEPGAPVESGARFELHPNQASVNERPYAHALEYVVQFPQSVRGLQPGAPVEFRGIAAGRVERVLLRELAALGLRGQGAPIPVLIRIEPGRLALPDSEQGTAALAEALVNGVANGLRASLATGSLITGSLYVAMDMYPDEPPAEIGSFAGRPTIPTIASGLAGIQHKLASLLDNLNALPLEGTVAQAERTLRELNAILGSDAMQQLPASLDATLAELRLALGSISADSPLQQGLLGTIAELDRAIESLGGFLETLEEQPNALIFNRPPGEDPRPPAGSP